MPKNVAQYKGTVVFYYDGEIYTKHNVVVTRYLIRDIIEIAFREQCAEYKATLEYIGGSWRGSYMRVHPKEEQYQGELYQAIGVGETDGQLKIFGQWIEDDLYDFDLEAELQEEK